MKSKIPLGLGELLANELLELVKEYADQAIIAGSIRRREETVGDIEIVIFTRPYAKQGSLFGDSDKDETPIDDMVGRTTRLAGHGWRIGRKNGFKFKQLEHTYRDVTADLFIIMDERAWGSAIAVRTGPVFFSKAMMRRAKDLNMHFADGFLLYDHAYKKDNVIPLPTERAVFNALKIKWLPPNKRRQGLIPIDPEEN